VLSRLRNWASISGDGRYVAYSNLIYDRTTNTATQFSNNTVSEASLSGDGRYLVTNENNQIYLYDNVARTAAQLLSVGTDGAIGSGASGGPIISPDGNHIGFDSLASNLVLNDTNGVLDVFMLDRPSAPTVSAITPSSGTTLGGTSVTIRGTNLTGATAVTIGGGAATSVVVVNDTTITAVTPAHTAAGAVDVVVTTPGATIKGPGLYTYVAQAPPTVTVIETLRQVAEPDRIVDHYPRACTACGAAMTPAMRFSRVCFEGLSWKSLLPLIVPESCSSSASTWR
jgi:IPT/TIG domain